MTEPVPAIDPSFVERLEHLSFEVAGVVDGFFTGLHRSQRRGGGLVFAEHRAYRPGDDPRTIDWRAFARSDHHRVKRFEHEAQLRALLLLDVSGSMSFGGPPFLRSKLGVAATLLGATAQVLLRQGDAAGVVLFHEEVLRFVPPRGGPTQGAALMQTLATPVEPGRGTGLAKALDQITERFGKHGAVVIATDLLDAPEQALAAINHLTARKHRVIVLHVLTDEELTLPYDEAMRFLGTEGEAPLEADPRSLRKSYLRELAAFLDKWQEGIKQAGGHYVLANTSRPLHEILREALSPPRLSWA